MVSHSASGLVEPDQERLWEAYWADPSNVEVRNRIAEMNGGLVGFTYPSAVGITLSPEMEEEAKQEGFLGLLRAIERYKPQLGFRFATYAPHWIRQAITRFLANSETTIRVPVHRRGLLNTIARGKSKFAAEKGRPPNNDAELAEFFGISEEVLLNLQRRSDGKTHSLDRPIKFGGEEGTLQDFVADVNRPDPLEALLRKQAPEGVDLEAFYNALNSLPERTREMMLMSAHDEPMSVMAQRWGVTRARVEQIIFRGIRDVRAILGVDPDLPVHSIRLAGSTDGVKEIRETRRGLDINRTRKTLLDSIGRGNTKPIKTGPSRRRRRSDDDPTAPEQRKVPARAPIPISRVKITEAELVVLLLIWKRLYRDQYRYVDLEVIAQEAKLPVSEIHLRTAMLLAKGAIRQDDQGSYCQHRTALAVSSGKGKDKSFRNLDLEFTEGGAETPTFLPPRERKTNRRTSQPTAAPVTSKAPEGGEIGKEIERLERIQAEITRRLAILREAAELINAPLPNC